MDLSTENSLFYHHSHFEDRWAFLGLIVRSQETFGRLYWVKIDQESTYPLPFTLITLIIMIILSLYTRDGERLN